MRNHSRFLKINYGLSTLFIVCVIGFLAFPRQSAAQMFSVGSDEPRYNRPQYELYLGLEPMTVDYRGGALQNSIQEGVFAFSGPVIRLGYNSGGLDLYLGSGGDITGIEEAAYFDFGGNIDFNFIRIVRSELISVTLPVQLSFRYVNITNNRAFRTLTLNRFRMGNISAGLGPSVRARPAKNFRIQADVFPNYGFAFSDGGFFGGSLGAITAQGRLFFDNLFGNAGLSLGYHYDFRNYNVDDNAYDYKITGHSIEIGITF